jgi:hypothetical protein
MVFVAGTCLEGVNSALKQSATVSLGHALPTITQGRSHKAVPLLRHFSHNGVHSFDIADTDKRYKAPHEESFLDEPIPLDHEMILFLWGISKAGLLRAGHSPADWVSEFLNDGVKSQYVFHMQSSAGTRTGLCCIRR